jgi:thiamine pyrophosphokinase
MNANLEVVIVSGGPPPDRRTAQLLRTNRYVIAVDSGYEHALEMEIKVDELIGDFDSLEPQLLEKARLNGVRIHRYPVDKEATDLELALCRVVELLRTQEQPQLPLTSPLSASPRVTILAGFGGSGARDRFDHTYGQIGLIASPEFGQLDITLWGDTAGISPIHAGTTRQFRGPAKQMISLIAVGGAAHNVTTTGLRFPLHNESLSPFSTRSISNEFIGGDATIEVGVGVVVAVVPNALTNAVTTSEGTAIIQGFGASGATA